MVVSEIFTRLGLDLDAASFARGQLAVEGIKLGLASLVGVAERVTRALVGTVERTLEHADAIDEASQAAGINTDALQELTYAAGFSAIGMEALTQTVGIFARNAQAAKDGSADMASAFRKAGVSMADIKSKSPDELLMQLADTFAAMPAGTEKTALALQLFGRSGKQLIPFLNDGSAGIGRLRQEARDMGLVLDEAGIKAGVGAADAIVKLKASVTGLVQSAIVPLIPMIREAVDGLKSWIAEHRADLVLIFGSAVRLVGMGLKIMLAVLKPLLSVLATALKYFKFIAIVLGTTLAAALIADASLFGVLGASAIRTGAAMVAAAARSAAAWVVAALPILAILALVGLVVLIVEDIATGMKGGKSFFGLVFNWIDKIPTLLANWFVKAITQWKNDIVDFFNWLLDQIRDLPNKVKTAARAVVSSPVLTEAVGALPVIGPALAAGARGAHGASAAGVPLFPSGIPTGEANQHTIGQNTFLNQFPSVASRPSGASASISAPTSITVVAAPGQDPRAVGKAVRTEFEAMWQGKIDELTGALGVR